MFLISAQSDKKRLRYGNFKICLKTCLQTYWGELSFINVPQYVWRRVFRHGSRLFFLKMLRLSSNLVCNIMGHSITYFWNKKLISVLNLAAILDLPFSVIFQSVLVRFASNSKSKLNLRFLRFRNSSPPPKKRPVLILSTLIAQDLKGF